MSKNNVDTLGWNMFYKHFDELIPSVITADYFDNESIHTYEADIVIEAHGKMHAVCLLLDLSYLNTYRLEKVSVRIRFNLAPVSVLINFNGNETYKYFMSSCKLWVQAVKPVPSSLIGVIKLFEKHRSIEYVFERPLEKINISC